MSPVLTEQALHEALLVAQRMRICELESEIRQAAEAMRRAEGVIREVLHGAGASLAEKLTAGAAFAEPQGILMRALIRPAALKAGDPTRDAPQAPLKSPSAVESAYVERQPLRLVKEQK